MICHTLCESASMPPRRTALYTTAPLTFQDTAAKSLKATATTSLSNVSASHQPSSSTVLHSNPYQPLPSFTSVLAQLPQHAPAIHAKVAELRGTALPPGQPDAIAQQVPFSNAGFDSTPSTSQFFAELFDIPMWNQPVGWDTLLSFDAAGQALPAGPASEPSPEVSHSMSRNRSDPGSAGYLPMQLPPIPEAGPSVPKMAAMSGDIVWKTILASQVEVEGAGQVAVSKVLQEVWQRGGGDMVSSHAATHRLPDSLISRCPSSACGPK